MNKSEMIFLYVRSKDECVRVSGGQKVLYMENNNKTFEKKRVLTPLHMLFRLIIYIIVKC